MTTTTSWEPRLGRDILTMPVYTISDGKALGTIDTLYVRRDNLSVPWVRLRTGALGGSAYLPYSALQTVGVDIALVASDADLQDDMPAEEKKTLDVGLSGRSVLSQGGESVGHLTGFSIDTVSGAIVALRVRAESSFLRNVVAAVRDDTVLVPAQSVASLGPDAVILAPDGLNLFRTEGSKGA